MQHRCIQRPNWVLFGDSITQKGSSPGGWVARLQDAYQRRIDVFNRGYSGYNTRWARAILPHMRHVMKDAQLVTVFLGANDAALPDLTSAVQHVPLSEYRDNLKGIISEIQEQGVKHIIIMTPPPVSEPHRLTHALATYGISLQSSERTNEVTRQYADVCVQVGADLSIPVLNLWDIFMKDASYGDVLLNDGLHLSAKGNELVYTSLQALIDASFPHLKSDAMEFDVPEFRSLISMDQDPMLIVKIAQYRSILCLGGSSNTSSSSRPLASAIRSKPPRRFLTHERIDFSILKMPFVTSVMSLRNLWRRKSDSSSSPVESKHAAAVVDTAAADGGHDKVVECILQSPLLSICNITEKDVQENVSKYMDIASHMIQSMGMPDKFEDMSVPDRKRVYQYYLPVCVWCESQLTEHKKKNKSGPLVLGISAPQGCGKSTLCEQLESVFQYLGLTAASVSIDDFYHTRKNQVAVAEEHAGNRLLEMRGNAGSHDVALGTKTLQALKNATSPESTVALPRYDKSMHQGKGDRSDESTWPVVRGPVDVVLFEGWMLGFSHVKNAGKVDPDLDTVNSFLKGYKNAWDRFVDSWLVIKVADPSFSHQWRLQAEKRMRDAGRTAMTDEEVAVFVDRFMPAYKCYLPGLYTKGPTTARKGKLLILQVDENREPLEHQPAPLSIR